VIRAVIDGEPRSREWLERVTGGSVAAVAPCLLHAEVANALRRYVSAGRIDLAMADDRLAAALDLPLQLVPTAILARRALAVSTLRGISAYDGMYLALALGFDAVLVTADRRLAEAAAGARVELLPPV
jgi:predicted nucleic acid-binding protein